MGHWVWLLCLLPIAHMAGAGALDPRDVHIGTLMVKMGVFDYMDQPYCFINHVTSEWVCTVTATKNHEGGPGEGVFALTSPDAGLSWLPPVPLEPDNIQPGGLANSYSTICGTPPDANGHARVFAVYGMNVKNVSHLPDGKPLTRSDEIGQFVLRYSDDMGRSWSSQRWEVPYRLTWVDLHNSFGGKVKEMWTVDQTKVAADGSVVFAFTKIGTYIQNPPEEVFFLKSSNLLTEGLRNMSAVEWSLLPEGDVGVLPPGINKQGNTEEVIEEGHVVPLNGSPQPRGWYAVGRTNQGFLAAAHTGEPTPAGGWQPTGYAEYFDNSRAPHVMAPLPGIGVPASQGAVSTGLKNPRGPITPKRLAYYSQHHSAPARYLLLFYNNAIGVGGGYKFGRDPYWLSAGIEANGTILWSQPEVILYDRVIHEGTSGGGYPDFVQNLTDGRVFITCTTKYLGSNAPPSEARVHEIENSLLKGLLTQHEVDVVATGRVAATFTAEDAGQTVSLAADVLLPPAFAKVVDAMQGFTVTMVALGFGNADSREVERRSGPTLTTLLRGSGDMHANASIQLSVSPGGGLLLTFASSDGTFTSSETPSFSWNTDGDATCTRLLHAGGPNQKHFVAAIVDAGPLIASFFVDGVLCDGGVGLNAAPPYQAGVGWSWINSTIGSLASIRQVDVGATVTGGGHLYGRALRTSEVVGNYRAWLKSQEAEN